MPEYIEREALIEALDHDGVIDGFTYSDGETLLQKIKSIPAADVVEVRHGEWIDKPSGRYMHIASWCSVCGQKSGIGGIESNRHKPYCPNCGANMRGEKK